MPKTKKPVTKKPVTKKLVPLDKKKTAALRKMAKALNLKEWETVDRKELIEALKEAEELPVPPESDDKESVKETVGVKAERVAVGSKAAIMKEKLSNQKKVTIMIPLDGEKAGGTQSVCLNGYRLNIRKGMYVEVPLQVANVIKRSQKLTILADDIKREDGKPMKIEGEAPVELR